MNFGKDCSDIERKFEEAEEVSDGKVKRGAISSNV